MMHARVRINMEFLGKLRIPYRKRHRKLRIEKLSFSMPKSHITTGMTLHYDKNSFVSNLIKYFIVPSKFRIVKREKIFE